MTASYDDAYLKQHVTAGLEARALAEVATYGTFSQEWIDRLVVPQAYVIICLEKQGAPDDLFSAKLKNYQRELDRLLVHARAATPDSEGNTQTVFGIPLERG